MLSLTDLGLSPYQLSEVEALDETLVASWLKAAAEPGVKSPTGFFLTGVRSGKLAFGASENDRSRSVHLAERWMMNCGILDHLEGAMSEVFDQQHSRLRIWRDDQELRDRFESLWRFHQR